MLDRIAPLFYLMGPSGSGKDTLLRHIAVHHSGALSVARRHITRSHDAGGEDHIAVDEPAFRALESADHFALSWRSHGLYYGIAHTELAPRHAGHAVIVNGSRAYLGEAQRRIDRLVPVMLMVERETLARRLRARGRETEAQIAARLQRNDTMPEITGPAMEGIHVIHNNATIETAATALLRLVEGMPDGAISADETPS